MGKLNEPTIVLKAYGSCHMGKGYVTFMDKVSPLEVENYKDPMFEKLQQQIKVNQNQLQRFSKVKIASSKIKANLVNL